MLENIEFVLKESREALANITVLLANMRCVIQKFI